MYPGTRQGLACWGLWLFMLLTSSGAAAAEKHALVIGNANYPDQPLSNTHNDARDISAALEALGFEIYGGGPQLDLAQDELEDSFGNFADDLPNGSVALLYYAGHGAHALKDTWLIPVDVVIKRERQIKRNALALGDIMEELKGANPRGLNLLFLDACRNNPFGRGYRSGTRGLRRPAGVPNGTFVGLAADEGEVAADGDGRNGLYTKHLLAALKQQPHIEIESLHKRVARGVYRESRDTEHPQRPVYQSNVLDDFCFAGCDVPSTTPTPETPAAAMGRLWINAQPADARVWIMNIHPKYSDGMTLKMGQRYDVLVTKKGYQNWREDVWLESEKQVVVAVLEGEQRTVASAPVQRPAKRQSFEPEMVTIPAGRFRMGDLSGEGDDDEKPVHRVNVQAFKLAKTEVTVSQFKAFVAASGYHTQAERNVSKAGCYARKRGEWAWRKGYSWQSPGFEQSDRHPVVCVSWNDAQAFITWLNKQTDKAYRLPSEAEWEHAARGGRESKYYYGDDPKQLCAYSNVADETKSPMGSSWGTKAACADGHWFTAPVARYRGTWQGLKDMHGNVREWVQDTWHESYQGAPTDGSAWLSKGDSRRVLRGGSWADIPPHLRSAIRGRDVPSLRDSYLGFRLAQS